MPVKPENRHRYPQDWDAIRARILRRSDSKCEATMANGVRCNTPNGAEIRRFISDQEAWVFDDPDMPDEGESRFVKVVLTIAHLNHTPEDNRDENLAALCQLHHLRHDKDEHAKNAKATRDAKQPQLKLFGKRKT